MSSTKKQPVGKKKSPSARKTAIANQKIRVLLASLFLLVFIGVCLFVLVSLRSHYQPEYQTKVEIVPPPADQTGQLDSYQQLYALIDSELLSASQSQGWQKMPAEGRLQRLKIFGDYPATRRMVALASSVERSGLDAYLDLLPRKGLVRLYVQNELRLELRYRVPIEVSSSRPQIAIIMDDMGRRISTFEQLLALDLMVTPSILPESNRATAAALFLQNSGREYMIHLPMQPIKYPRVNPGPNALLIGQSEEQTRRLVRHYLDKVPGAVGGNNHMGSRYTEESGPMRILLDELQQNGLFFIDSKTISTSVGYDEARKLGVPTARRNIFLDNEEDITYIRQQIRKMVRLAEAKGELVAICHPYPETLKALRQELPWLKQQPIDFVPSSAIVRNY